LHCAVADGEACPASGFLGPFRDALAAFERACDSVRRQRPTQALETREIAIEGDDSGAVLDRERRKMRIRRQISGSAGRLEQSPEDLSMPLAWVHDLRLAVFEPTIEDAPARRPPTAA
jgi:hypothetical protein